MVYPIGFGAGSAGLNGTGFQLLAIIFTELFGVTLAQLIGALAPSIQVCLLFFLSSWVYMLRGLLTREKNIAWLVGWDVVQFRARHSAVRLLRCRHSVSRPSRLAAIMVVPVEPLGQDYRLYAHHRTTVRPPFPSSLLEGLTTSRSLSVVALRSPAAPKNSPSSTRL